MIKHIGHYGSVYYRLWGNDYTYCWISDDRKNTLDVMPKRWDINCFHLDIQGIIKEIYFRSVGYSQKLKQQLKKELLKKW